MRSLKINRKVNVAWKDKTFASALLLARNLTLAIVDSIKNYIINSRIQRGRSVHTLDTLALNVTSAENDLSKLLASRARSYTSSRPRADVVTTPPHLPFYYQRKKSIEAANQYIDYHTFNDRVQRLIYQ